MRSSPDFFYEAGDKFCLAPDLEVFISSPAFIRHFKDVIDYKTRRFYKEMLENKMEDIYKLIES